MNNSPHRTYRPLILFFSLFFLAVLAFFIPEADAFQSFNDDPDCTLCHGPEPEFNCKSCHTVFDGGSGSAGHVAHLDIGLLDSCSTCHINPADDPPMANCVGCHVKAGLVEHHNYVAEVTPLSGRDTGLCWMCHVAETPNPENVVPPGYLVTCLDPCDGSEELFSTGSYTVSLDNDGDLLVDMADPDCAVCVSSMARITGAVPADYASLQDAYNNAAHNDLILGNNIPFTEASDLLLDQNKTIYFEGGYDCTFTTIIDETEIEGTVIISDGVLVVQDGTVAVVAPFEICDDGVDNDSDGDTDCVDIDCENDPACSPPTEVICNDCVDNDSDGFADCLDPDCYDDPSCPGPPTQGCNFCHGGSGSTGAPLTGGDLVGVQDPTYPATGGTEGAHVKHVTDLGITDCEVCHSNNGMPAVDEVITIGFTGTATDNSSSPSYDGVTLNAPYSYNGGVTTTTGTQDCSNVYCHSSVQGAGGTGAPGSYATPDWGAASVACDSCHGQAAETDGQPDSGSHAKHAGSAGENYGCSTCHNGAGSGTVLHADGTIDMTIDAAWGGAYSQGDHAPGSGGYGTCITVYCHSDGQGNYTMPQWGGTSTGCDFCHDDLPTSGAHAAHVQSAAVAYGSTSVDTTGGTYDFGCANCHPTDEGEHRDGEIDITMNSTHGGTLKSLNNVANDTSGYSQTSGISVTCSAAYCHSEGDGTFDVTSPNWYGGSLSGSCDDCHGNSPSTNAHSRHVVGIHYYGIYSGSTGRATAGTGNTGSHGNSAYSTTINCDTCHNNTVTSSANDRNSVCGSCHDGGTATLRGDMAIAAGSVTHLNGTADVELDAIYVKTKAQVRYDITTVAELSDNWDRTASGVGYKEAGAYDQAKTALNTATMYNSNFKSCSGIACHNGNSAVWSDSGRSCSYCHSDLTEIAPE